jgi:hypothetical protein
MTHIKLEHIDNLRRGKKSWAKIGSRWTPHHLYKYEEEKYERALKNKYLEISDKDRINLENLWEKVCIAKGWKHLKLIKSSWDDTAEIFFENKKILSGTRKEMKEKILLLRSI